MKMFTRLFYLFAVCALAISACNLPSGNPDEGAEVSGTFAAQTIEALLTTTVTPTFTSLPGVTPVTNTPAPTNTSISAATATPVCPQAQFVTDVTIPDGTVMSPGQAFTKKWRIRNTGTCQWSGYTLVFDSGDSMNGPATQPIGVVSPGQEIDIEVNLTAPAAAGNYRGYWRIVSNNNVLVPMLNGYQGRAFYVDIKVQGASTATNTNTPPPLPPAIAQVVLVTLSGEDGHVASDGTTNQFPNVGDNSSDKELQAFVSFDMSLIPAGATITKVEVNFSGYDMLGSPFSLADGCLRAYAQNYGTLDAGDFIAVGDPTGAYIRWCGAGELSSQFESADMKTLVQSAVGSSRLQLRLQFKSPNPNGNATADAVRFGDIRLIVTYQ